MWWSEWWNFLTHSHLHSPCSLRRIQSLYLGAKWKLGGLTTPNSPPLTACSNQAEKIGIFSRDLFSHFWRWLPLGLPDESWLVNFPLGVVLDFIQMAQRTPVYAYPSPKTHATKLHLIPQAWNTPLLGYYVTMWHLFPLWYYMARYGKFKIRWQWRTVFSKFFMVKNMVKYHQSGGM